MTILRRNWRRKIYKRSSESITLHPYNYSAHINMQKVLVWSDTRPSLHYCNWCFPVGERVHRCPWVVISMLPDVLVSRPQYTQRIPSKIMTCFPVGLALHIWPKELINIIPDILTSYPQYRHFITIPHLFLCLLFLIATQVFLYPLSIIFLIPSCTQFIQERMVRIKFTKFVECPLKIQFAFFDFAGLFQAVGILI